jgi:hypothetical protein
MVNCSKYTEVFYDNTNNSSRVYGQIGKTDRYGTVDAIFSQLLIDSVTVEVKVGGRWGDNGCNALRPVNDCAEAGFPSSSYHMFKLCSTLRSDEMPSSFRSLFCVGPLYSTSLPLKGTCRNDTDDPQSQTTA